MDKDSYILLYNKHRLLKDSLDAIGKKSITNWKRREQILEMDYTIIQQLTNAAAAVGEIDYNEYYYKLLFNKF